MRIFYTVIYSVGFVLLSPLFLYKMWRRGKYRRNFLQRFGLYGADLRRRLTPKPRRRGWLQAVSVGEVNVSLVLLEALRHQLPDYEWVVTTTTSTGYALARERLPRLDPRIELLYFPQDFPVCVRRAYDLLQPDLVVLMESEIWPNHIWAAVRRGVPVCLVNGRMSPRSARGYRRVRWLFRSVFSQLSLVCAQSAEDAENFASFGVPRARLQMTGNMKYDAALRGGGSAKLDPSALLREAGVAPDQPVIVAGSTHPGEESILFDLLPAWRRAAPGAFLVVVPRHVERTEEVAQLANRKQIRLVLRSELETRAGVPAESAECLLVNTTGELARFYEVATVIFVGKSLAGRGGQNIVEAARSGHPVVFGPHMQNFQQIAREFVSAGAGVQVTDADGLRQAVLELLTDPGRRQAIADGARRVITANLGAAERNAQEIAGVASEQLPGQDRAAT